MIFLKNKTKNKKGFTLIELIVAVALFIVVVTVVIALFVSSIKGQRKAIAVQNVEDNARFLMGFINKEIRMSEIQSATYNTLNIIRSDGESVTYFFNDVDSTIERTDSFTDGPINSEEVLITGRFNVIGLGAGDDQQPRVTITMKVETGDKVESSSEVIIQTTLSTRNLEI